ncbi:DUF4124 domain-containing protein [Zestomonas carbonaria]|uniref:DUF4124 domain-containing protein n=1 Tax=Zestomonas carbonaria TaxID=2762745 RepID=A0A7U7I8B4_9GAMM|nr:DUF4124 domain-containing protein [Pseudomonas carbonaria]CAD5106931.1 hypothetical protein PSEWESI4_01199 [Pseudomonas carbonaria]
MGRMILTGSLLLALSASAMASQVYKWVDEKGVTHFGAQPPEGQAATQINTTVPQIRSVAPTLPPADASADDQQKALDEKIKKEVASQELERKKYCENTRNNLAQLRNNPRVRVTDDNGEVRRIDEEERQQRIRETEKAIQENCQ